MILLPLTALSTIEEHFAHPSPHLYILLAAVNKSFRSFFLSDALWNKFNVYKLESNIANHYLEICRQDVEERGAKGRQYGSAWFDAQLRDCSDDPEFRSYMLSDKPLDLYSQLEYIREFDNLRDERVLDFDKTVWMLWKPLVARETQIHGVYLDIEKSLKDGPINIPKQFYATRDAYLDLTRCVAADIDLEFKCDKHVALTGLMAVARSVCYHGHMGVVCRSWPCWQQREDAVKYFLNHWHGSYYDKDTLSAAIACSTPRSPEALRGDDEINRRH